MIKRKNIMQVIKNLDNKYDKMMSNRLISPDIVMLRLAGMWDGSRPLQYRYNEHQRSMSLGCTYMFALRHHRYEEILQLAQDDAERMMDKTLPDKSVEEYLIIPLTSESIGNKLFAQDLGFEDSIGLLKFAESNPDIWGNDYGYSLFWNNAAFSVPKQKKIRPGQSMPVKHLIRHLRFVAKRVAN